VRSLSGYKPVVQEPSALPQATIGLTRGL